MGTSVGKHRRSVSERLQDSPEGFDFHQLVSLVAGSGAEDHGRELENIHFSSEGTWAFPTSDVAGVKATDDGYEIVVRFMGLLGAHGAMAQPFSELIMRLPLQKKYAALAFLDVFNDRLIRLFADNKRKTTLALQGVDGMNTEFSRSVRHVIGISDEDEVPLAMQRCSVAHANVLGIRSRSWSGFLQWMGSLFDSDIRGEGLCGDYVSSAALGQVVLGDPKLSRFLGEKSILGTRVWLQDAGIRLHIKVANYERYCAMLPGGEKHNLLQEAIADYLDGSSFAHVHLYLEAKQRPVRLALEHSVCPRLGFNTWLTGKPAQHGCPGAMLSRLGS